MTDELTKTFFDTFGIEPEEEKYCLWECRIPELEHVPCSKECKHQRHDIYYPEITDRILLELICIDFNENPYKCRSGQASVDEVKERILSDFIHEFENDLYLDKQHIKHQVRTLFEEGNNDR